MNRSCRARTYDERRLLGRTTRTDDSELESLSWRPELLVVVKRGSVLWWAAASGRARVVYIVAAGRQEKRSMR
jgi:hypothetical protein